MDQSRLVLEEFPRRGVEQRAASERNDHRPSPHKLTYHLCFDPSELCLFAVSEKVVRRAPTAPFDLTVGVEEVTMKRVCEQLAQCRLPDTHEAGEGDRAIEHASATRDHVPTRVGLFVVSPTHRYLGCETASTFTASMAVLRTIRVSARTNPGSNASRLVRRLRRSSGSAARTLMIQSYWPLTAWASCTWSNSRIR